MYEIQKEAATLETLRKRAQVSYGIYAVGLLAAVIMAFVSNIIWAAVIAALIFFIYILYGRKTVKTYRKKYAYAKLKNELFGVLEKMEYADRNLYKPEQLQQDKLLEIRPNTEIIRTGVKGETMFGDFAELADVAFQINIAPNESKEIIRVLTGCYMRFQKKNNWNLDACVFEKSHSYRSLLERYYEGLGYRKTEWNTFLIYSPENSEDLSGHMKEQIAAVGKLSNQNEILRFYPDKLIAFMQGRFLNYGEPDFKHEVKIEQLRKTYYPEIKALISLLHA